MKKAVDYIFSNFRIYFLNKNIILKRIWKFLHNQYVSQSGIERVLSPSFIFWFCVSGIARTQIPTIKNYALDIPTLGVFARVSLAVVQWQGLAQEEPPSWSRCPPRQVSYRSVALRIGFNYIRDCFLNTRNYSPLGVI